MTPEKARELLEVDGLPGDMRQLLTRIANPRPKAKEPQPPRGERPKCGAKTREGRPCLAPAAWDRAARAPRNGRCKNHGGASTGPKTPEGKARVAEAQRARWEAWRAARARTANG
jgi:hypothetical protein